MKIKKLKPMYRIVKPFKVKQDDSSYSIPKLGIMYTYADNWKEAKEELMAGIHYMCNHLIDMPKKKMSKKVWKEVKHLKKHIEVLL